MEDEEGNHGKAWSDRSPQLQDKGGGRESVGGMGRMWMVSWLQWLTVLLGLLPLGSCGGQWTLHKTLLALVTATLSLVLTCVFLIVYVPPLMLQNIFDVPLFFMVCSGGYHLFTHSIPVVIIIVLWVKGRRLSTLLQSLKNLTQLKDCKMKPLPYLFKVSIIILLVVQEVLTRTSWYRGLWDTQFTFAYCSIPYALFCMPLVVSFSMILYVTAGHILQRVLSHNNDILKSLLSRHTMLDESYMSPMQRIRKTRQQYIELRQIHQDLSDILSLPMFLANMEKFLWSIVLAAFLIVYPKNFTKFEYYLSVTVFSTYVAAIYVQGYVADVLREEGGAPLHIVPRTDLAETNERVKAQLETEVEKILQISERPLNTQPCGLFLLSRTNILAMASTFVTNMVILLQFLLADESFHQGNVNLTMAGTN
ncbi:uncharacterized protein LOC121875766 [Homarus americanus]|uniref:uncharacterized protein LOC121875766 n=1 Tax=Homarus americanus TaxID=6706 RepID=UPI001C494DD2|nr:uncharacterized protein LOC121875766 [Homarus americanus]